MRRALFILLLLSSLLLSSCQSIVTFVRSRYEGVPKWVITKPQEEGMLYFIGYGSGSMESQARGAAVNDLLDSVSVEVGQDITGRYYRELMSLGSVAEAELVLVDEFARQMEDQNAYECYVLASASGKAIDSVRGQEYRDILAREDRIGKLLEMATESYRENNDVEAVIHCLEAVEVSASGPVKREEYQSRALLDRAIGYLSNIRMKVYGANPEKGSVKVKLIRHKGLFHPNIVNAEVMAQFPLSGYADKTFILPFKTGRKGNFTFQKYYSPMANEGTVHFYLDFSEQIAGALKYLDEAFFEEFYRIASSITGEFTYSKSSFVKDGELVISLIEYDARGNRLDTSYAQEAVEAYFINEGIAPVCTRVDYDSEEEVLSQVRVNFPDAKYLIWGRVGLYDVYRPPTGNNIRTAEGRAFFYRLGDGSIITSDDHIRSVTWVDEKSANEELFRSYGEDIAAAFTNYL